MYLRPGQHPTPRRVGKLFSPYKGRIVDGKAIQLVGETNKVSLWTVGAV